MGKIKVTISEIMATLHSQAICQSRIESISNYLESDYNSRLCEEANEELINLM